MNDNLFKGSRILLVEDEESLAFGLIFNLTEEGYSVVRAKDGKEAIEKFSSGSYDLIILDVMLPFLNGYELSEIFRKDEPYLPILMLTARTGTNDKIKGFESGADDYVTKPFHLQELLWRIKAILKRKLWYKSSITQNPVYKFGDNEINFESLICKSGHNEFRLTPYEAMTMQYLIENKGKIISRKELLTNVWNTDSEVETRTVDNFIARLRKHFEPDPANPVHIKSVRGAGYIYSD